MTTKDKVVATYRVGSAAAAAAAEAEAGATKKTGEEIVVFWRASIRCDRQQQGVGNAGGMGVLQPPPPSLFVLLETSLALWTSCFVCFRFV